MKLLIFTASILLTLVQVAAGDAPPVSATNLAAAARAQLQLRNGDLLFGKLLEIDPTNSIRWKHPDSDSPIDFKPGAVAGINFNTAAAPEQTSSNLCRIRLTNEDELEGNLADATEEQVVLNTWFAGPLTFPRKLVQWIAPIPPRQAIVFEGPASLEGWTMGNVDPGLGDAGEWKFKNGAFYAVKSASIARKLDLPDLADIEFDLAWKGMLHLALAIYTDSMQPVKLATKETEPDFGGFYSLQLNSFSANLLPVKKHDPLKYLGQASVPAFGQNQKAHVRILVNKAKNTIALLVDGALVKEWIDTDFAGEGSGIRLVHQGQGAIKFSHLRIRKWDGQYEEKPSNPAGAPQDLTKLRNGDKVSGKVESIRDGKVKVATPNGPLEIPFARVKQIGFSWQRSNVPPDDGLNAQVFFPESGSISFHLETWTQTAAAATSPFFGRATFNPSAFERVQLNLR